MKQIGVNLRKSCFCLFVLAHATGCASFKVTKLYDGAILPPTEYAIVRDCGEIVLLSVDGKDGRYTGIMYLPPALPLRPKGGFGAYRWYKGFELHLTPGMHRFQVGLPGTFDVDNDQVLACSQTFDLKAGHFYQMTLEPDPENRGPPQRFYIVLTDMTTRQVEHTGPAPEVSPRKFVEPLR